MNAIDKILAAYELTPRAIQKIETGHIHHTYKVVADRSYILQRVNRDVFKRPEIIAANTRAAANHLTQHFPSYLFMSSLPTNRGEEMVYDGDGYPWRISRFIEGTVTYNQAEQEQQAFSAAQEFARLARYLQDVDVSKFQPTIERFHDLGWRFEQFQQAEKQATQQRLTQSQSQIQHLNHYAYLVEKYQQLIETKTLKLRITHNDTKINNILFDEATGSAIAAIDLDTLMPGYFIYDLGDMVRTFVCPVSEEERDLSKIIFRPSFYKAVVDGYLSQMSDVLTSSEKKSIPLAGLFMTYIMALRFLTDFLNGNVYYHTHYEDQNLVRAQNQLRLLDVLTTNI